MVRREFRYLPSRITFSCAEDDPEEPEDKEDDGESWWPDAEGVTLFDEEEEEDDSWDDSEKVPFSCLSCGKKTRLNPKGCDKVYCYFCGKETRRE